ncbi:hypothetical protein BJV74DRAFT_854001 [Russula compacta]|nr:hypothetical protein BJV74DRAFT_854001 [Russula compacta]
MAAEYLPIMVSHLKPGGRKSGAGTEFSISEIINKETDELLQISQRRRGFWKTKTRGFKGIGVHIFISEPYHTHFCTEQSFIHDEIVCLLMRRTFMPFDPDGLLPALAHIIPNSVQGKPNTLKCIAMFASVVTKDVVMNHLNNIGNAMNMELNAHTHYDNLHWGIEAKDEG